MKIEILKLYDDADPVSLGIAIPPDHLLADTRSTGPNSTEFWDAVLLELWNEWRQVDPEPDTDDEFIVWLKIAKGWYEKPSDCTLVFIP